MSALAGELSRTGLGVENLGPDDYGFGVVLRLDTKRAYLRLGPSADDGLVENWALLALDQRSGGPRPPELLPHIDAALRNLQGVFESRWHRRERHLAGDHYWLFCCGERLFVSTVMLPRDSWPVASTIGSAQASVVFAAT